MTSSTKICVSNREYNGYDDSDFYSTFWVEGTEEFVEVMVGSTRFGGGRYYTDINATPEIKEMYSAWLSREAAKREATIPRVGKQCTLKNARKYKNMIGKIVWIGKSNYDSRVTVAEVRFENYSYTTVTIDRIQLL